MVLTHNRISPALKVMSSNDIAWDKEHDVLVVGFGGAGVTAALQASDKGADVAVIDRFEGGGATAICGNVVYAGGGTSIQREAGVDDTVDDMFAYLRQETQGIVKGSTLRKFCHDSADNLEWLMQKGVRFNSRCTLEKTSYPKSKYYLYHSGSETNPKFTKLAKPAPRGHIAYNGWRLRATGNPDFYKPLKDAAFNQGIRAYFQSEVQQLIVDDHNRVIGVKVQQIPKGSAEARAHAKWSALATKWHMYAPAKAQKYRAKALLIEQEHSQTLKIQARNGVILSSGGFIMNRDMVKQFAPLYTKGMSLGTTGCNGSGIALGHSVGGKLYNMDRITAWRFINPPLAWAKGMLIGGDGKRFTDETLYGAAIGDAMCLKSSGKATLIINRTLFREALSQILPGRARGFQIIPALLNMLFNSVKAKTITALATKLKVDTVALKESLSAYNHAANGLSADEHGKPHDIMQNMEVGPYYAMDVSLDSKLFPCPTLTLGGLRVNEESGLVQNEDGHNIKGLYAAGRTAIGIASNSYVSGLSLADCVFSGRRAGAHAAQQNRIDL